MGTDEGGYKWQVEACRSCGMLTEGYVEPGEDPADWYCHNCWNRVGTERLQAEVTRLRAFILSMRREHSRWCEKLLMPVVGCTCGAESHNAKLDKVLACGS